MIVQLFALHAAGLLCPRLSSGDRDLRELFGCSSGRFVDDASKVCIFGPPQHVKGFCSPIKQDHLLFNFQVFNVCSTNKAPTNIDKHVYDNWLHTPVSSSNKSTQRGILPEEIRGLPSVRRELHPSRSKNPLGSNPQFSGFSLRELGIRLGGSSNLRVSKISRPAILKRKCVPNHS